MTLTPPPPAPRIADPTTFEERADARMAWQDVNVAEMTALAADVTTKQKTASAAASTATTKAGEASESAEVAEGAARTATTKASQALESAEAAAGAASAASSAASTATEKAAAASESAESAAALIASIAGGPVASVNGKPGPNVVLDAEDVGAQPVLKSGESIKTVGGVSLLGDGDIPISNAGSGGAVITGNVVLTAASPGAMTVTPDIPGRYVTLPDATTCSTGAILFTIHNTGDVDYGIKDSTGTKLGWIRARTGGVIGLSVKTTAAGIWTLYGVEKAAVTAMLPAPSLNVSAQNGKLVAIPLDANRTCLIFGYTSVYAVIHDASTGLWGAPTYIAAPTASCFHACLAGTDKVLFVSANGTTLSASVLSCTGTTAILNATTTGSSTGNFGAIIDIIPVGASFVVSSFDSTNGKAAIRAIAVTGNVTAVGDGTALTGNDAAHTMMFASGSVVRTVSYISASAIYARPFTVSGTTLTPGGGISVATSDGTFRAFVNSNGNIVCNYINGAHYASIFRLTGTTETVSSVNIGSYGSSIAYGSDYIQLPGGRTVFASVQAATLYAVILTDTNGVASAGAQLANPLGQIAESACSMVSIGSAARFFLSSTVKARLITLDCAGAAPTMIKDESVYSNASSYFYLSGSLERGGGKRPELLVNGSTVRVVGQTGYFDLLVTPGGMCVVSKAIQMGSMPAGVHGASSSDSWFNAQDYGTGALFVHVEAAA